MVAGDLGVTVGGGGVSGPTGERGLSVGAAASPAGAGKSLALLSVPPAAHVRGVHAAVYGHLVRFFGK